MVDARRSDIGTDDDGGKTGRFAELPAVDNPLPGVAVELEHRLRQPERTAVLQIGRAYRLVGECRDVGEGGACARACRRFQHVRQLMRGDRNDRRREPLFTGVAGHGDAVTERGDPGHRHAHAHFACARGDMDGGGCRKERGQVDPRQQQIGIVSVHGECRAQEIQKDLRGRCIDGRVQGGQAQRFPQQFDNEFGLIGQQRADGELRGAAKPPATQAAHEHHRLQPVVSRQAAHGEQRDAEMPGRWQCRRLEPEHAGLLEVEPPPIEELALGAIAVHRPQQRQRLRVCSEQHVLAVVDGAAVDNDAAGATAEHLRGFEDGHRPRGARERDRGCHAGPAAAHDRDPAGHLSFPQYDHDVFHAIHALVNGVKAILWSSTRNPSRSIRRSSAW